MKVAVVEREELGGICLNRGCIPTKAMLRSAEVFNTMQHSEDFGILAKDVTVDFGKVIAHREKVVKQLVGGVGGLL
jgi:dihydrolipoamide dehydrogenase